MPTRESHPHGMPSWCDMSSRDIEAAKAFYGAVFGWEMHTAPEPEAGGYTMALLKGRAAAAITPQQQEQVDMGIPPHWTMYFTVDDVDSMAAKVEAAKAEAEGKADYDWECELKDANGVVVATTTNRYQMRSHGR